MRSTSAQQHSTGGWMEVVWHNWCQSDSDWKKGSNCTLKGQECLIVSRHCCCWISVVRHCCCWIFFFRHCCCWISVVRQCCCWIFVLRHCCCWIFDFCSCVFDTQKLDLLQPKDRETAVGGDVSKGVVCVKDGTAWAQWCETAGCACDLKVQRVSQHAGTLDG